jgi:hypothetical protein
MLGQIILYALFGPVAEWIDLYPSVLRLKQLKFRPRLGLEPLSAVNPAGELPERGEHGKRLAYLATKVGIAAVQDT